MYALNVGLMVQISTVYCWALLSITTEVANHLAIRAPFWVRMGHVFKLYNMFLGRLLRFTRQISHFGGCVLPYSACTVKSAGEVTIIHLFDSPSVVPPVTLHQWRKGFGFKNAATASLETSQWNETSNAMWNSPTAACLGSRTFTFIVHMHHIEISWNYV